MAESGTSDEGKGAMRGGGLIPTIAAVAILTVVAGGGGVVMGGMLGKSSPAPEPVESQVTPAEMPAAAAGHESETMDLATAEKGEMPLRLIPLKPVLTNIYAPPRTWVRIEASVVVKDDGSTDPEVLAAEIESDTLAFLRSVQLAQIEGTRGLLHLRDDLRERARLRSPAVIDYLIQTMVAE